MMKHNIHGKIMPMTEQTLLHERYDNHIAVLTFNRPQSLNALNLVTMQKFASAIDELVHDDELRVLILTGAGERAFSSGADLNDLADKNSEADALNFITIMGDALLKMERLPIPVIAAINGYALGGGSEIALACDMRIVDEKVRLGMVQMRMGVTPGWGAGQRLMRLVGYSRTMQLLLRAHVMHAPEIKELGLAMNIVEAGTAFEYALTFARRIAQSPPETVRGIKHLLQAGLNHPYEDALAIEREIFPPLWAGEAHKDAVDAFLEHQREYEAEKAKQKTNP
jgi:enoyl-CoA hydratase